MQPKIAMPSYWVLHGRRGLHDEGSEILMERLAGKVEVDKGTARRCSR